MNNVWYFIFFSGFHLSFSLINDEPETGILNWNIQEAIASNLAYNILTYKTIP